MTIKTVQLKSFLASLDGQPFGQFIGLDFQGDGVELFDGGNILQVTIPGGGGGGESQGSVNTVQTSDGSGGFLGVSGLIAVSTEGPTAFLGFQNEGITALPAIGNIRLPYEAGLRPFLTRRLLAGTDFQVISFQGDAMSVSFPDSTFGGDDLSLFSNNNFELLTSGPANIIFQTRSQSSIRFGSVVPATGMIRIDYNSATIVPVLTAKDSGGTDRTALSYGPGDGWNIGNVNQGTFIAGSIVQINSNANSLSLQVAGVARGVYNATGVYQSSLPRQGLNTAFASDSRGTQAMADANQVAPASVYGMAIIRATGALTADRTLTIPAAATEAASYIKWIENDCTGSNLVISSGGGLTVTLNPTNKRIVSVTPDGVEVYPS